MAKPKRQISFFIETELWKAFLKKCIDKDKSKTEIIVELIKKFLKEN
ncbi:MAG: hypothetical protein ABIH28_03320 [archaeon]